MGRSRRDHRHPRLGVTLDHPALQTTTTGQPKIVDWVTYTDPFTDNDPTWAGQARSSRSDVQPSARPDP